MVSKPHFEYSLTVQIELLRMLPSLYKCFRTKRLKSLGHIFGLFICLSVCSSVILSFLYSKFNSDTEANCGLYDHLRVNHPSLTSHTLLGSAGSKSMTVKLLPQTNFFAARAI